MLLGALLTLLLLGGAAPAWAHAVLRGTDPADASVLTTAPDHLTLTFTESVALLDDSVRVFDPGNHRLRTGEPQHAPGRSDTVRVTLPAGQGRGTYTVAWRVVSADSHPVSGAFTYSVGAPTPAPPVAATQPENTAVGGLYDLARYAAYLGAALLIGGGVFRALAPGAARTPTAVGWTTLAAATAVLLLLRAPYERGTGLSTVLDPSGAARTLTTRPGIALVARLGLLAAAGVLVRRRAWGRRARAAGAALAFGLALTWAVAEHAAAGIQVPVAMAAALLHLLAAAVWLGGLVTLLCTSDVPVAAVTRFSRLALGCVTVLALTGVYQSWRGLGSLDALTGTGYGRLLLLKLAAVTLLLTAAAGARHLTGRLRTGAEAGAVRERLPAMAGGPEPHTNGTAAGGDPDPALSPRPDRRLLRRAVLVETALGALVLLISTVLAGTLPGRAAAEAAKTQPVAAPGLPTASVTDVPFDVGTPGGRGKVQVTLDPGRAGDTSVQAVVYGPDGGLATVPELRVSFTLPAQRIGPIDARVTDRGGYWAADRVTLPLPGTWTMKVTVRVSETDQVSEVRQVVLAR
ncbi:transporter [Streptomyces sp. Ru71]|uniref:copper resistance CopC/CopD family protein n=1 Tax=Streptomyces sp. Ru71 TaxID=2080746 RepID=UPI000CDD2C28|nr:copper resistance protein CopC [Streptomyces sp. Ru71]POX47794.1 transporter [Streptomyces sp. Ru71]